MGFCFTHSCYSIPFPFNDYTIRVICIKVVGDVITVRYNCTSSLMSSVKGGGWEINSFVLKTNQLLPINQTSYKSADEMISAWEKHGHFWDSNRHDQSGFFFFLVTSSSLNVIGSARLWSRIDQIKNPKYPNEIVCE